MKKKLIFGAMLVCLLALGLMVVGCDNGSTDDGGGGGGGGIPAELVGNWYSQAAGADIFAFEITSSGKLDNHQGGTIDVSVSGNTITLSSSGYAAGTVDYSINNSGQLILTNGTSAGASYATLSPLVKK
jgi:uncharacterized lipoprotein NlpE involved in copper resistance